MKEKIRNKENQYWDPTGELPDVTKLKINNEKNLEKSIYWKKNLPNITKIFYIIYFFSFFLFLIIIFISKNFQIIPFLLFFYGIIISIFYLIIYSNLKKIKKDLIKAELATSKNWLYESEKSKKIYNKYYQYFPEIFDLGEKNQSIEDVFWGKIEKNSIQNYFVSGVFNYTYTKVQKTKNRTRRVDVNCLDHFFILKLPKKISSRFYLFPKNLVNNITNLFTKKNIQTESLEFNKRFSFSYKEKGSEVQINIMSILSPRVIEELVNFVKTKEKSFFSRNETLISGVEVLFTNDVVIFLTPGPLIEKLKVSCSAKSLNINQDELNQVEDLLNFYINTSTEISKYLN